jgi:hypothetical protein
MDDVNEAWRLFLISQYIVLWTEYYLKQIGILMENEDE